MQQQSSSIEKKGGFRPASSWKEGWHLHQFIQYSYLKDKSHFEVMEINSWGLFVRLVHDTNRSTKILSINLYFNEVLESYKKLLYQESSLTCIKTQVWFCKQKYEVTSSVSYRCIERDKGVILCSFVQDNTNLGQTLQSAINPYFTDLRNNVILHLQWEKNVVSNTCFNNLHVKLWVIYTPYVKLF